MSQVPNLFRRFIPQLLHLIVLPIFFFSFMLIHRPTGMEELLGSEWFGVHLTIISCIIMLCMLAVRMLYYFLPMKINYALYIFWCFGEMVFTTFFVSLYLWLVLYRNMPYFEVLTTAFPQMFFTLLIPYVVLALSMRISDYHEKKTHPEENSSHRMRFYDNMHNLKIVLMPQSILYIASEANYVSIYYTDNGRVREYVLRSSMKAIDELCQDNGLVRCHRSFYINPSHVKVLRRDKEGVMYAELDADDVRHIPVSKTYYNRLSEML